MRTGRFFHCQSADIVKCGVKIFLKNNRFCQIAVPQILRRGNFLCGLRFNISIVLPTRRQRSALHRSVQYSSLMISTHFSISSVPLLSVMS